VYIILAIKSINKLKTIEEELN